MSDPLAIEPPADPTVQVDLPMDAPGVEALADPGFWDSMFLWQRPLLAAAISAVLLGHVGIYVVLARSAFVSAAVSQLSGLGIVLALLLLPGAGHGTATLAGLGLGVLGTALFALPRPRRVPNDATLAMAVIAASALTLVLASRLTREYQHVQNALYGDAVVATTAELWLAGVVAAVVLLVHVAFRHRFLLVLQDPDTAAAQGMPVRRWSALLGVTIGLSIAVTTTGIGALPAFGFSVLPAAAALLLTTRMLGVMVLAPAIGLGAALLGYYLSFDHDLPTGPAMVSVLLAVLLVGAMGRAVARR